MIDATVPYPLVVVRWVDSRQPSSAWGLLSDLDTEYGPADCYTAGWVVHETEGFIALAMSVADLDDEHGRQCNGVMRIPKRCIIKRWQKK